MKNKIKVNKSIAKPYGKQLNTITVRRRYCVCGDNWAVDTNIRPPEDFRVVCCKCHGYVTVDQVPMNIKFPENFGNQL